MSQAVYTFHELALGAVYMYPEKWLSGEKILWLGGAFTHARGKVVTSPEKYLSGYLSGEIYLVAGIQIHVNAFS